MDGVDQSRPCTRIVIVGGGTAGWLAAAHLSVGLAGMTPVGVEPSITIVAAAADEPIGVGEATIPSIRSTLEFLGIELPEFAEGVGATTKLGIRFEGWHHPGGSYFHPFATADHDPSPDEWLATDDAHTLDGWSEAARARRLADEPEPAGPWRSPAANFAFHLDTHRFAALLRRTALDRGVHWVDGRVTGIETVDRGSSIRGVITDRGERLEAELFVDCTGFSRTLVSALRPDRISFTDALPVDRALVARHSRPATTPTRRFTTATAHEAGWTWQIDLARSSSTGVVYSSAHMSETEAEEVLRRHATSVDDHSLRTISFASGRLAEPWVGNCLALGLAGAFVEPLESTGIFLIEDALHRLASRFPRATAPASPADQFNRGLAGRVDCIRDFLVAHYCTSDRAEPFWSDVREAPRSAWLEEHLDRWRHHLPTAAEVEAVDSFVPASSWTHVLRGMNWLPARPHRG